MPLLSIQNLRVDYRTTAGTLTVLPDFSLDIEPGERFGLVGESGCGKTTLLMAMLGYMGRNGIIAGGRIVLDGQDLTRATPTELAAIRGSKIAVVYQEPASALNPTLTVGRQLTEVPMQHRRVGIREARDMARRVLADVHMADPDAVLGRYPHQLSGGQKQRVVIAMALLANPALLLLDEPTTGLDVTVEAEVLDLISELRDKYGTALFYVSHNLGVIARVCERVGVMYAGELVEDAPAEALFGDPRHPYTRGLLASIPRLGANKLGTTLTPIGGQVPALAHRPSGCAFMPRCPMAKPGLCDRDAVPLLDVGPHHLARCLRWQDAQDAGPDRAPVDRPDLALAEFPADRVLEVDGLTRIYEVGGGRLMANEDLRFGADRGQIIAVVGESGSGKSTFARVLAGLDPATRGALRVAGTDVAKTPVAARTPEQVAAIQMVFQNPDMTLNPSHRVSWPIARALRNFGIARGRGAIEDRILNLFRMVRLPAAARHRLPRQLSGGQKQRVAIARAFAGNPALLIADEPVSALDVSVQAAVVNLLLQIQAESRTTMVFISHDLALVRYLADQVVVMYLGRVMESGPVEALFHPPYHPYTEALLSAVPIPDPTIKVKRIRLRGEIPSPLNPPKGCRFAGRCPRKVGTICDFELPPVRDAGNNHLIACHIPLDVLSRVEPILETV